MERHRFISALKKITKKKYEKRREAFLREKLGLNEFLFIMLAHVQFLCNRNKFSIKLCSFLNKQLYISHTISTSKRDCIFIIIFQSNLIVGEKIFINFASNLTWILYQIKVEIS